MDADAQLILYASPEVEVDLSTVDVEDVELVTLAAGEQPPMTRGPGVWVVRSEEFGLGAGHASLALAKLDVPGHFALVLVSTLPDTLLSAEADARVFAFINPNAPQHLQAKVLRSALNTVRLTYEQQALSQGLQQRDAQLRELNQIGVALSAERDVDRLLEEILRKAREITGCDAGSLYLVENVGGAEPRLRFKLSQNDSFDLNYSEFTMPLNTKSLAGYTGTTGESLRLADVYHLPEEVPYRFSRAWDEDTGYRTKSVLVIPMRNNKGEIRGVLQLINRKRPGAGRLVDAADFEREVVSFDSLCEQLVGSLASQAAVALENQILLKNISMIFEGVLSSWVKAVEDRDPATAGHSQRVTAMTLALARAVHAATTGPYAGTRFNSQQMEELRYAGLLHDIGKIYVRVDVFLKAKKLYAHHLRLIEERFDFVRRTLEAEYSRRKLDAVLEQPEQDVSDRFGEIDRGHRHELELLNEYFEIVLMANEPTVLAAGGLERLADVASTSYKDIYGNTQKLLQPDELRMLNIRRGNLDDEERHEIESHVTWSYRILSRIPWPPELQQIPFIAWGHHEKLDGTGYPNGLSAEQIPLQAKIMTIADIYDALTAADRPYKKAQTIDSALRILGYEAADNHIDADLLALFVDNELWRVAQEDDMEATIYALTRKELS